MTRDEVLKEFGAAWNTSGEQAMAEEIVRLRELVKGMDHQISDVASMLCDCENERDGLKHIVETYGQERDELLHELSLSRLANEEQAKRLATVEAERDALKKALAVVGVAAHGGDIRGVLSEFCTDASEKVERLTRTLAALREPSLEIRDAVMAALNNRAVTDPIIGEDIDEIIEAAVTAAEDEVSHGARATQEVGGE